jgi:hypothetical protein
VELDQLIRELLALVLREFPSPAQAAQLTDDEIAEQLDLLFFRIPDLFTEYRRRVFLAAWEEIDPQGAPDDGVDDPDTTDDLRQWWKARRAELHALADTPGITGDVVAARARSLVEREVSTQLVSVSSEATLAAAALEELTAILQPERDACLICTSYAGAVCAPGAGGVRPVRNFTAGPLPDERVTLPLHPRCRCDWVVTGSPKEVVARSAALIREAERSVLRFDALPSESDRARTEAAERLLASGSQLAKTVVERSSRAVRRRKAAEQKIKNK